MERPEQVYLDVPIEIKGIKIGHTRLGAQYMAEHYQGMLDKASKQQLGDNERQHLQLVIRKLHECIQLYETLPAIDNGAASAAGNSGV